MFWKIALGVGVLGVIIGAVLFIISYRMLTSTVDSNTEDMGLIGVIASILLTIFSFLLIFISIIFVLRSSKKDFDAKNAK